MFIALISLAGGLFFGILFSKFAELGMVRILDEKVSFSFAISFGSVWQVIVLFAITFALIFLNTLRQIHLSNPIALLHSENFGGKTAKSQLVHSFAGSRYFGSSLLSGCYDSGTDYCHILFFVAVIMVIVATYMLFISGSVTFCRLLQKSKTFYYKTNHFIFCFLHGLPHETQWRRSCIHLHPLHHGSGYDVVYVLPVYWHRGKSADPISQKCQSGRHGRER